MDNWRSSKNHVVLLFPPLAGGKFISYCLSLSDSCVPWFDLTQTKSKEAWLEYKLDFINSAIPLQRPNHWIELSPPSFWGYRFSTHEDLRKTLETKFNNEQIDQKINPAALEFLKTHCCFSVIHNQTYQEIWSVLPNCKIIHLINSDQFRMISLTFKGIHELNYIPVEPIHHDNVYHFDVDRCMFDWTLFKEEIIRMLHFLEVDSLDNLEFLEQLHARCINLHVSE